MKESISVKCGEFWLKDGIIIKRPGKSFRIPDMPNKYKIKYPTMRSNSDVSQHSPNSRVYEDIDQMNSLREQKWQKWIKDRYHLIKCLYYMYQFKKFVRKTSKNILNKADLFISAIVREYE